jgi:hypothetical protein
MCHMAAWLFYSVQSCEGMYWSEMAGPPASGDDSPGKQELATGFFTSVTHDMCPHSPLCLNMFPVKEESPLSLLFREISRHLWNGGREVRKRGQGWDPSCYFTLLLPFIGTLCVGNTNQGICNGFKSYYSSKWKSGIV